MSMATRSLAEIIVGEWWNRRQQHVDQAEVDRSMVENGLLTPAYIFLVFISCAIATLGLLLDSAAVVIGAMLIAPLMGPINLLGYSIAKTNLAYGKQAALALGFGVVAALVTSYTIVNFSPFIPPTAQILARTNPNFFDLLVAVFSGMVAGFAIIRQQGGTFAGVAIATALMPPLATSGYGWANASWDIFSGAFLLFLTNMLAIAFSVTGVSLWYGLGKWPSGKALAWRGGVALFVLALLSIPLVKTLNSSVSQAILSKQVQDTVNSALPASDTIQQLKVLSPPGKQGAEVNLVVLTRSFDAGLEQKLNTLLDARFGKDSRLTLDQIVANTNALDLDRRISAQLGKLAQSQQQQMDSRKAPLAIRNTIIAGIPARIGQLFIDENTREISAYIAPAGGLSLADLQNAEITLSARLSGWQLQIIPPPMPLPVQNFAENSAELNAESSRTLVSSAWALKRWGIARVVLTGHASLNEDGRGTRALAQARVATIATALQRHDIDSQKQTAYPMAGQAVIEREQGKAALRSVYLTLGPTGP
ncbi:DUF389 domain-containing protein [Neisseriaceae bacterium B2N2-7]|uniref:DUF389 domain-containing protein n=2 Tax=Craterilacuibacter sinensis TaxID=2686017 RepID=A0A845BM17_9NEIS|nr:DUF389 domain-containing protein [Craterilacuibacter sinensis]